MKASGLREECTEEGAIGMLMDQCMMVSGPLERCTEKVSSYIQMETGLSTQPPRMTSARYDGEFNSDMKEGFGVLQYVNGERYEGQWKGNFAHGAGSLTYADGDKYVGDWIEGKKSGNGELIYVNGDKFRGQWLLDKASGKGILEYANGDIYDGEWANDQRHGKDFIYSPITIPTGKGKFFSSNTGVTYVGEWKDGMKHGQGAMYFPNGDLIMGKFSRGSMDGPVTFQFNENSPWADPEY